jgi:hypothetical protein
MSTSRVPNPRTKQGPEYVLRCTSHVDQKSLAVGKYYAGMHDYTHSPMWMCEADRNLAQRMRGAGLASAKRSLENRGYTVERVNA